MIIEDLFSNEFELRSIDKFMLGSLDSDDGM